MATSAAEGCGVFEENDGNGVKARTTASILVLKACSVLRGALASLWIARLFTPQREWKTPKLKL
jgi:hypothetical protein